jgi:hypothetical protein
VLPNGVGARRQSQSPPPRFGALLEEAEMNEHPLQKLVNAMSDAASAERGNYHLTLGKLVEKLRDFDPGMHVIYDMAEQLSPSSPQSYRGYYSDLSFPPSGKPITVKELLAESEAAIGATFEGYKGGDFVMHERTPLWASGYGDASGIAIMDAKVIGDRVILITKQID